jgi:hypothetical protein
VKTRTLTTTAKTIRNRRLVGASHARRSGAPIGVMARLAMAVENIAGSTAMRPIA